MRWSWRALAAALLLAGSLYSQEAAPNSDSQPKMLKCGPEVVSRNLPYTVYKVGRDAKAPKAIYSPDPEYADSARRAGTEGTVVMGIVVTAEGTVGDAKVCRSVDPALDQKAIETVNRWKFEPATKDGQPVAVFINVQMMFRLYHRQH